RIPEPAVIQIPRTDLGEPVRRGSGPPPSEPQLRARVHHPVQRGQREVGTHAQRQTRRLTADDAINDAGHVQPTPHPPARADSTEGQVPGPLRLHARPVPRGRDVLRGTQIPLGDHPWDAAASSHLTQVPVRTPTDLLRVQTRHNFRSYTQNKIE